METNSKGKIKLSEAIVIGLIWLTTASLVYIVFWKVKTGSNF